MRENNQRENNWRENTQREDIRMENTRMENTRMENTRRENNWRENTRRENIRMENTQRENTRIKIVCAQTGSTGKESIIRGTRPGCTRKNIFTTWKTWCGLLLFPPRCPVCGQTLERDLFALRSDMSAGIQDVFALRSDMSADAQDVFVLRSDMSAGARDAQKCARRRNPWICGRCQGKLKGITGPVCRKCGKRLTDEKEEYCADCRKTAHVFDQNRALWEYSGQVKVMLHRLKYSGCADYAEAIGWEMSRQFGEWVKRENIRVVIPIPLHKARYRKRGYNQAERIAEAFARRTGLTVEGNLLLRSRNTRPQMSLSAADRKNNLKKAFKMTKNIVQLEKVLLLDDIYTTGSTLDAAAEELKRAGVKKVYCVSAGIGSDV